jgi:hypothetical protein
MKIAYLTADRGTPVYGRNGASVHIREFVNALSGMGHQVTILAARRGKREEPLVCMTSAIMRTKVG